MRFSIRDLLWLVLAVAMALGWWTSAERWRSQMERASAEHAAFVKANWNHFLKPSPQEIRSKVYLKGNPPPATRDFGNAPVGSIPEQVRVHSNKTLIGVGAGAKLAGGGIYIRGANNIILRNLTITDSQDGITIERGSHHIWIDHCDLSRCQDGLIDIKTGSDLITISWNHFHDHHKACLLGHSDDPAVLAADKGKLRVTYHHNFFDGTKTRHPRVRIAEPVHVFNNYYLNNQYAVAATADAGVIVEANYFEGVRSPTLVQYGKSAAGRVVARDNVCVKCKAQPQQRGTVQEIGDAYPYTLDKAKDIPKIVRRGAGVGKVGARDSKEP
jgi:pectate lyase